MEQQKFPDGMADMISELAKNPAVMSTLASLLPTLLSSAGAGSEKKTDKESDKSPDTIYLSPDAAKGGEETKEEPAAAPPPNIRSSGSGRALLLALKPYLSEERRSKLDRIASLSDVLEAMGTFSRKGDE